MTDRPTPNREPPPSESRPGPPDRSGPGSPPPREGGGPPPDPDLDVSELDDGERLKEGFTGQER